MENYRLDILGLSEVRWDDFGDLTSQAGVTLLYSGRAHGETTHDGVGLLLNKRVRRGLMEWYPISERIIIARFQSKIRNISVVQCYAPTETSEEVVKQEFYVALTDVLTKIKQKGVILLMGDFNAKVGQDNEGLEHIMGKHGFGERNENGELFVNLCASQDLVIGGTLFPHKECHKVTRVSPDHRTENQVDHVAVSRKWRRSLQDVRNKRGADVGTDHHLVVARFIFKISAATRRFQRRSRLYDQINKTNECTILTNFILAYFPTRVSEL
jgi:endonuclease/exonuclease/phosphatase family metal-dependent hydrolase